MRFIIPTALLAVGILGTVNPSPAQRSSPQQAPAANSPGNRSPASGWLELRYSQGVVSHIDLPPRTARIGDRLQEPGQGIRTSPQSAALLFADNSIGQVRLAGASTMIISRMERLQDGGRIISINIPQGQARFTVRHFTNPNSRFEVATPAGVAAVRGTDFGVSTDPQQRTNIATLNGTVAAQAQGQEVLVNPGFLSQIIPGQPPSAPRILDRQLDLRLLTFKRQGDALAIRLGIHPDNLLLLNGEEQTLTPQGRFIRNLKVPAPAVIELIVRNALGEEKKYRLREP